MSCLDSHTPLHLTETVTNYFTLNLVLTVQLIQCNVFLGGNCVMKNERQLLFVLLNSIFMPP